MSKVTVQGNASGTGTLTIAAPNTNSNYTLDLPTAAGTIQVSGNPISGTTGTFSGTISGGSTVGVGGATPSASGAGITFPATQSASTDVNTLDDYEEGTFTPTLIDGSNNQPTSYNAQVGVYTKVGSLVTVNIYVYLGTLGATISGNLQIGGLPFTSKNTANLYASANVSYWGGQTASFVFVGGWLGSNATKITLYQATAATANLSRMTAAQWANGADIVLSCIYTV